MEVSDLKQRILIIGIFGGGKSPLAGVAENLGGEISKKTNWIVLTGGEKPDPNSTAVKHRALVGPYDNKKPWIGFLQKRDRLPGKERCGFVFKTPLGHKRNYLEAVLCDAAIAVPGELGTWSEVVAMLCLGKPVVLVGDHWSSDTWWSRLGIRKPDFRQPPSDEARNLWIHRAKHKLNEDKSQAPAIDALIERDITAENLIDAHNRCVLLATSDWPRAIDKVLDVWAASHQLS